MKWILSKIMLIALPFYYGMTVLLSMFINILRFRGKFFHLEERENPPKVLEDPFLGEHHFVTANGIKIHYVSNGDPSNELMLMVHGFPEFWFSWRHQLKEFGKDYYALALDLRGYGETDKPAGVDNYKIDILLKDIKEFMIAIGKSKGIVVGHDWGGAISYRFAWKYPEMVEKLIIMNAPHGTHFTKLLKSNWTQFRKSWYIFFFQLPYLPELTLLVNDMGMFDQMMVRSGSNDDLEAYKYTFSRPGALTPPINYYRANFNQRVDERPMRITVPTLVIWGKKDIALVSELASGASQYCDKFNCVYIEDGTHFIQTHLPGSVNDEMRKWLGGESLRIY